MLLVVKTTSKAQMVAQVASSCPLYTYTTLGFANLLRSVLFIINLSLERHLRVAVPLPILTAGIAFGLV
jgi:hypothetical protein